MKGLRTILDKASKKVQKLDKDLQKYTQLTNKMNYNLKSDKTLNTDTSDRDNISIKRLGRSQSVQEFNDYKD